MGQISALFRLNQSIFLVSQLEHCPLDKVSSIGAGSRDEATAYPFIPAESMMARVICRWKRR
jgi:hypothetical protein